MGEGQAAKQGDHCGRYGSEKPVYGGCSAASFIGWGSYCFGEHRGADARSLPGGEACAVVLAGSGSGVATDLSQPKKQAGTATGGVADLNTNTIGSLPMLVAANVGVVHQGTGHPMVDASGAETIWGRWKRYHIEEMKERAEVQYAGVKHAKFGVVTRTVRATS